MTQYQMTGTNARLKPFTLLAAQGIPAAETDDLVGALETGAVARTQSEVVELDGMGSASRGPVIADGWDEGVTAMNEALTGIANRDRKQRGSRSTRATEPALHATAVRQRERAGLERLEVFVRETVLPRTYPHTMKHRHVLEALGWGDRLCTTRTMELTTGEAILCTREAGHYDLEVRPEGKDSGGWHKCNLCTWIDDRSYNYPHTAA
ncbi:hypothetical protein ACFXBB_36585 [Streptomyces scopuliridis]|uniref:hypothetical protein n=1 Tax=Streptomyces scopuliridis TaxID=452529 RepID=UPI0036939E84